MQYSPTAMTVISHHFVNARRHVMMLLPYIVHLVHSSFECCLVVNGNDKQSNGHWSCYFCTCTKLWIKTAYLCFSSCGCGLTECERLHDQTFSQNSFSLCYKNINSRLNTENDILYTRKCIHAITLNVFC